MSRLSRRREGSTEATCSTLLRIDQDDPVSCRSTIESCSRRTSQDTDRLDVFGVEVRDPFTGGTSRTEARTVTCLVSLVTDGHPVDYVEDVIVTSDGLITTHDDTRTATDTSRATLDVDPSDLTVQAVHKVSILDRSQSIVLDFLDVVAQRLL